MIYLLQSKKMKQWELLEEQVLVNQHLSHCLVEIMIQEVEKFGLLVKESKIINSQPLENILAMFYKILL